MVIAILMSSSVVFAAEEENPYNLFKKPGNAQEKAPQVQPQVPKKPQYPQSQQPGFGQLRKLPSMLDCGSALAVKRKLKMYKEVEMMTGKSAIQAPHGLIEGELSFYVNPSSGSYSMVFFLPESLTTNPYGVEACLINVGKDLVPGLQGDAI